MRLTSLALLIALAARPGAPFAASADQLAAIRDAAAPGECTGTDALGGVGEEVLASGDRLYLVPCRATFANILQVVVLEHDGQLHALSFPDPGYESGSDGAQPRLSRIGVTTTLPDPQLTPEGRLAARLRLPPGLGTGWVLKLFAIDDGNPVLLRFAIEFDAGAPVVIWQAP